MRVSSSDASSVSAARFTEGASPSSVAESGSETFARVFEGVGLELNRGEAATQAAVSSIRSGADLSTAQLLVLQMQVYRYSETIDLASHAVDRVTSGVKTILQGSGS